MSVRSGSVSPYLVSWCEWGPVWLRWSPILPRYQYQYQDGADVEGCEGRCLGTRQCNVFEWCRVELLLNSASIPVPVQHLLHTGYLYTYYDIHIIYSNVLPHLETTNFHLLQKNSHHNGGQHTGHVLWTIDLTGGFQILQPSTRPGKQHHDKTGPKHTGKRSLFLHVPESTENQQYWKKKS